MVPTSLGFFYKTDPFNATIQAKMDRYCAYNAAQFQRWAQEDERLIGMFPFYWPSSDTMVHPLTSP